MPTQKQMNKSAKFKASKAYQFKNRKPVGIMDIIKNPLGAIKKAASNTTQVRRRAGQVAAGDPIAERKYGTGKRTGDRISHKYPSGVFKFQPDGTVEKPLKSYKKNPKLKSGFSEFNKGGKISKYYASGGNVITGRD